MLDVVSELDLGSFYGEYREDGRGGAAYDPALVLPCSSTPTASGNALQDVSSAGSSRTSPSGSWVRTSSSTTPLAPPPRDRGERLGVGELHRRQLADEILAEAERQDTEEDERFVEPWRRAPAQLGSA